MSSHRRQFQPLAATLRGAREVFRERGYLSVAAGSAAALFALYLFVPVWLVPANTLAFEFSLFTPLSYLLLAALALMSGTLFSLELFALRHSRGLRAATGRAGASFTASLAGGVLTAASCGCGVGMLLGAVGLAGGASFLVANQTLFVAAMLGVVALGLYFSARRAAGVCAACRA